MCGYIYVPIKQCLKKQGFYFSDGCWYFSFLAAAHKRQLDVTQQGNYLQCVRLKCPKAFIFHRGISERSDIFYSSTNGYA
jgi:hypothetical protein